MERDANHHDLEHDPEQWKRAEKIKLNQKDKRRQV